MQVLIVFVGGAAFQVTHIGGREWGISLALGFVSIPLGALLRAIPNGPIERFFIKIHLHPKPELLPTSRDVEWNSAIDMVRDNLNTFAHVRGARMRASSYVDRSRKARPQQQQKVALYVFLHNSCVKRRSLLHKVVAHDYGTNACCVIHRGGLASSISIGPVRSSSLRPIEILSRVVGKQDTNTSGHQA